METNKGPEYPATLKVVADEPEQVEKIEVPLAELEGLLGRLAQYEANEDKLAEVCYKGMNAFGLIDKVTGEPVEGLRQNKGVVGIIINAVKEHISITDLMFNKKKAEKDLAEKFSFFSELTPLFEAYARRKRNKKAGSAE